MSQPDPQPPDPDSPDPPVHAAAGLTSRRALGDIASQVGGQVVNLSLGIVTTVLLARALGTTHYGEWATLLAASELAATVGNLGLEPVAVRHATQDPEREGIWVGAATSLQLALSVPVIVAFLIVVAVIASDHQMLVAGVIMSLLFVVAAISTLRLAFQLRVRNHIVAAFVTVNSIIWTGSVIAIAAAGGGIVAFAIAFVITSILTQSMMALVALHTIHVHWRGSRALWGKLARVGISVGIASTLTLAYGRIDQILIFELTPNPSEVGLYAATYKILDSAGAVPGAVMMTLFPVMASLYPREPARLRRIMQAAIDYLAIIALGGLGLTIVAASPIIEFLYGQEFLPGASLLPILFGAFVPICIGYVAGNMVIAADLQHRYILIAVTGLIVNVGLNLVLIPRYGVEGAAWVTLVTEVVVVSTSLAMVLRRLRMSLSPVRVLRAAAAAAVASLAVWGVRQTGVGAVGLVPAMGVMYPLALICFRAIDLGELRELIRARQDAEAIPGA